MVPLSYTVRVPEPDERVLRVEVEVPEVDADALDMQLPVWTPGSYLIREYPRHVQDLEAHSGGGRALDVEKSDKATWVIDCPDAERVVVEYAVYAHDLNVREKHVDDAHAFFNPTAVYLRPADRRDSPAELSVEEVPEDWNVHCPLPASADTAGEWHAEDLDHLYDATVEMGDHEELTFEAAGTTHRMVFRGEGNWDRERLERDLPHVVEANAELFGGDVPYDDYLFVTLLSGGDYGGLEHRNSTALIYPRDQFGTPAGNDEPPIDDDDYLNFLSLVAHEQFHVWNVKRLFPEPLERPDYQREEYVRQLWTIEGVTSYYDRLALLRGDRIDVETFLEMIGDRMARYDRTPGRRRDSIEEAGFDAWIKHYRRDEHTDNLTVSYYLKGALVAMLLDLRIRGESRGEHSLDDLVRHLWSTFGPPDPEGFPEGTYRRLAAEFAGVDLDPFFDDLVAGSGDIDWNRRLDPVGLKLETELGDEPEARLGVRADWTGDDLRIETVLEGTPAHQAGLHPGDRLVAIDGRELDRDRDLDDRLERTEPGESVPIHFFRRDKLSSRDVRLDRRPPTEYNLVRADGASGEQLARLDEWLGTSDVD
ncbi:MAG: M61 family metallopeptidase [Bradymonadaceae bacterium]